MIALACLHPAALLRGEEGASGTAKFKETVIHAFRKAKKFITHKPSWNEEVIHQKDNGRQVRIFPTAEEVIAFCQWAQGKVIAIDVEATGLDALFCDLICVGIAVGTGPDSPDDCMCVPILKQGGSRYWDALSEDRVREAIRELFADPKTVKVFHNMSFDCIVLDAHGLPVAGPFGDTLLAHHCVDGELPHSLSFVSSVNLESPYWKEDVKGAARYVDVDDVTMRVYNCLQHGVSVLLEDGTPIPIQKLVNSRLKVKVLGVDAAGRIVPTEIYDWHRQRVSDQQWVQIRTAVTAKNQRGLICTPDHQVFTRRGRISAAEVQIGDELPTWLPPSVRYKVPGADQVEYLGYPLEATDVPVFVQVTEARPIDFDRVDRGSRMLAETRYCISTRTGNFFTTTGLVKNCRDTLSTIRCFWPLMKQLEKLDLVNLYHEEIAQALVMMEATKNGVLVDLDRRAKLAEQLEKDRAEAMASLQLFAWPLKNKKNSNGNPIIKPGEDFNPRAVVTQVRPLLFDILQFPIVKLTDKGAPSTDKEAMVLLSYAAKTEAQIKCLAALLKYRKSDKLLSTYVYGLPIGPDGRIHPAWKVAGTVSGRYASSPNMQNLNALIKKMFMAALGRKLIEVDLSQAEIRGIGYITGDPPIIEAYKLGLNVHTVNTTLLFRIRNPGEDTNPETESFLESECPSFLGCSYQSLPVCPKDRWKKARTMAKVYQFSKQYGAVSETIYSMLKSTRDPKTDELLFPDLTLKEIEAYDKVWEKLHPTIVRWWKEIVAKVTKQGYYRSPLSGRIRWFRAGFARNEILNFPVQSLVADHMRWIVKIAAYIKEATNDTAKIVMQVHDALFVECPDEHVETVKQILKWCLSQPFALPGYPEATLPPDEPKVAQYLSFEKPKKCPVCGEKGQEKSMHWECLKCGGPIEEVQPVQVQVQAQEKQLNDQTSAQRS